MTCRICYEPDNLVCVCACGGSVKWVHLECMQRWIDVSHRQDCELCGRPFDHTALRKPIYVKHLFEWCLAGMTLGTLQSLSIWFCFLFDTRLPLVNVAIIFTTIFTFFFAMATLILWLHNKRARPFVASYFGMLVFTNVTLQICVPAPDLIRFYIISGCLVALIAIVDYALFVCCRQHCHRLH